MRCGAQQVLLGGVYRCMFEVRDGHTEHQYNYYRALTTEEKDEFFRPCTVCELPYSAHDGTELHRYVERFP